MTAAVSEAAPRPSGLRPVNPRRDLAAVADLIERAFAGQLDRAGRRMVRDMRAVGRLGPLAPLLGPLFLPSAAFSRGFVWEEAGRVVGNASLLPVEGHPRRWVLANVAVHPSYRRRGIARRLVAACVEWARERGAREVVLQVKAANAGAQALYASLGFRPLTTRTTWTRPAGAPRPAAPDSPARPRRPEEWRAQWALARRLHPEGLVWPYPLEEDLFRPSRLGAWLGLARAQHWVWAEAGALVASLTARLLWDRAGWRLALLVAPEGRGRVEADLLATALADLRPAYAPVTLEHPVGLAEDALRDLGFRAEHTLTWMGLDLGEQEASRGS